MINTSVAFKEAIADVNREFSIHDKYAFTNRSVPNISMQDFLAYSINEATSESGKFQIGAAVMKKYTATLDNSEGKFSLYNFEGANIIARVGLKLPNGTTEILQKGTYRVVNAVSSGITINVEAYDSMLFFDQPYSESTLRYPATIQQIIADACRNCGVAYNASTITMPTYRVQTRPKGDALTYRDVISYCAQIMCCYAKISHTNVLVFGWYDFNALPSGLDGGYFDGIALPDLARYLNTTAGMTVLRNNVKQDDGTDTVDGVDWFTYNNVICSKIYVSGNHWIGFGARTEHLKVCRRDGAMYYLYRQVGESDGTRFLKLRWEGYTSYSNTAVQYALKFELFLLETGQMFLNVIQTPTNTVYLGVSELVTGNATLSLDLASGDGKGTRLSLDTSDSVNWVAVTNDVTYQSGDNADGGSFYPWNNGDDFDGGDFEGMNDYHHIYVLGSQSINTDDIQFTGVRVTTDAEEDSKKQTYLEGKDGYVLAIEGNPLVQTGAAQTIAEGIGGKMIGRQIRPLTITCQSDPSIEAGDCAVITDIQQNSYATVITNTTFTMGGMQQVESSAETPTEKEYASCGTVTKLLSEAKKATQSQIGDYDLAVQQLNQLAANTMGFFATVIKQEDGSAISYRHDKAKLSDSKVVYKSGIDGFFVTANYRGTDAATTWSSGFDASGNAVVNILSAVGINFDWARGGTLTLGGGRDSNGDNRHGSLVIKDANEVVMGTLNNAGLVWKTGKIKLLPDGTGRFEGDVYANNGIFKGRLEGATGTFGGALNAATGTFKGALNAATGTFSGDISAASGTFKGGIKTSSAEITGGSFNVTASNQNDVRVRLAWSSSSTEIGPASTKWEHSGGSECYVNASGIQIGSSLPATADSYLRGSILKCGSIISSGKKERIVETRDFGVISQYCYEMPSPMFGDIGCGVLDDTGICYIDIDTVFAETVTLQIEYQVFLQKEGPGDLWVDEKTSTFFIVRGTPGLRFSWEIKAKQRDYEYERMEVFDDEPNEYKQPDYAAIGASIYNQYVKEMEEQHD